MLKKFKKKFLCVKVLVVVTLVSFFSVQKKVLAQALNDSKSSLSSQALLTEIELVVSDPDFASSSKVVVSKEQIESSQTNQITTLLATQANLNLVSTSFQPYSVFLRGGDSSHILFLVDGLPFYDTSSIQRTTQLSALAPRQIKKIEIIKGSQSVLYGGQALAGVIKIETFPQDFKSAGEISVGAGIHYAQGSLQQSYKLNNNQLLTGFLQLQSEKNVSPVEQSNKLYPHQVAVADLAFHQKLEAQKQLSARLVNTYDQQHLSTTDQNTQKALDTENYLNSAQLTSAQVQLKKENFFSIAGQHQISRRSYQQKPENDLQYQTGIDELYLGQLSTLRLDYDLVQNSTDQWLIGAQLVSENLTAQSFGQTQTQAQAQFEGVFIKTTQNLLENIKIEAGLRHDSLKFKTQFVSSHVGLVYNSILKLEQATGFLNPSLYQLYSSYGNLQLLPEQSKTTSLSLDLTTTILEPDSSHKPNSYHESDSSHKSTSPHKLTSLLNGPVAYGFTVFNSEINNLIQFRASAPFIYENIARSETRGVEAYFNAQLSGLVQSVRLTYGYQEPKNLKENTWLIRRPLNTASVVTKLKWTEKLQQSIEILHTGSRLDYKSSAAPVQYATLASYQIINTAFSYQLQPSYNLVARIDHLTGQKYEASYGYYVNQPKYYFGLNYYY